MKYIYELNAPCTRNNIKNYNHKYLVKFSGWITGRDYSTSHRRPGGEPRNQLKADLPGPQPSDNQPATTQPTGTFLTARGAEL